MVRREKGQDIILVSACLTGLATRYDGKSKKNYDCIKQISNKIWIPVCPEQLGGLPTPRVCSDIIGGDGFDVLDGTARVINRQGIDVTENFIRGAEMVLEIASSLQVSLVILKAKSPSCAVSKKVGITAALLRKEGYTVMEY